MRFLKVAIPAVVALTGLALSVATTTYAKPEYTKTEKKPCTACHTKMGAKELNDAGKYYKDKKTLDGYKGK